ncbi:MAG: ECF-type sigma factor [Gemmatimonadales bacterium]
METETALTDDQVTTLLEAMRAGDDDAAERLLPLVYRALHGIAARLMRGERDDHTLQPTILLHDAWARLTAERNSPWKDRRHFMALAARAMRRQLIDHARARRAGKRRADLGVSLAEQVHASTGPDVVDLIALDDALHALAAVDDRAHRVVELRYFGALEWPEVAEVLGASERTVKRDWQFAQAWLRRWMDGTNTSPAGPTGEIPSPLPR